MDPKQAARVRFLVFKSWRQKAEDGKPERAFTTFVASTDVEDRYDDVIDQGTWRLANYQANPIILIDHYYSVQAVVGRGTELEVGAMPEPKEGDKMPRGKSALRITVEWDLADELGASVCGKVERGFINAVSVGCRSFKMTKRNSLPKDHWAYSAGNGYLLEECELYEVSVVAVPANQEALAQRAGRGAGQAGDVGAVVRSVLEQLVNDDALWRTLEARRLAATASSTPPRAAPAPAEDRLYWVKDEAPAGEDGDRLPWT